MQTISVRELRDNLARIIEESAIAKKRFEVTKFGRSKVAIVPIEEVKKSHREEKNKANVGEWLLSLAKEAEKYNIRGPKDLATTIDKYLYGN